MDITAYTFNNLVRAHLVKRRFKCYLIKYNDIAVALQNIHKLIRLCLNLNKLNIWRIIFVTVCKIALILCMHIILGFEDC